MTARATATVLLITLGGAAAVAVVGSRADPPISGVPATVYLTQTETVHQRYQGRSARWWATRAVRARREANRSHHALRARRITLHRIRASLRDQVQLGANGLERAFLCIHRFEGSWADTGAPYWGGVQMDYGFMRAYAPAFLRAYGPASNWTPAMQLATAERAYLEGRGFGPWPNTSRMCGLR